MLRPDLARGLGHLRARGHVAVTQQPLGDDRVVGATRQGASDDANDRPRRIGIFMLSR
jgi:hypothetical protein